MDQIKFFFRNANPVDVTDLCKSFNRQVATEKLDYGTLFRVYPQAEKGIGFSGNNMIVVKEVTEMSGPEYGDFPFSRVEPMMQELAQAGGLVFEIRR
jgi:hypothetical protein